jgi:hypothetical protein
MDIAKIQSFLSYTPYFNQDTLPILDSILDRLPYLSEEQKLEVHRAYRFALLHHGDIVRLS